MTLLLLSFNLSITFIHVDLLALLYICLYQWDFPFVLFIFLVAFSFSLRKVPLTFLVKLVWWC